MPPRYVTARESISRSHAAGGYNRNRLGAYAAGVMFGDAHHWTRGSLTGWGFTRTTDGLPVKLAQNPVVLL